MSNTYHHEDKDGIHALSQNLQARRWNGNAPTSGLNLTINTGNLGATDTCTLSDGSALAAGTHYAISQQNVGIPTAPSGDTDRWDLVGLDETGTVVVDQGEAEIPDPVGVRFTARKRPSPPDLTAETSDVVTPLWLVYLEGGTEQIDNTHLVDRRSPIDFFARQAHATGMAVKSRVAPGESATVEDEHSMVVVGPYEVEGEITIEGRLRVID